MLLFQMIYCRRGRRSIFDDDLLPVPTNSTPVVTISEVIPSRGMGALEGEGRGLFHLEVIARGRLWRQLASRGIDRGAQRVNANLFTPVPSFYSSCDYKPRYHRSWTLIPTPIQVFAVMALLRFALFLQSLPPLTRAIPSMSETL